MSARDIGVHQDVLIIGVCHRALFLFFLRSLYITQISLELLTLLPKSPSITVVSLSRVYVCMCLLGLYKIYLLVREVVYWGLNPEPLMLVSC